MARIGGVTNERIFSLKKWGGLNEAPDGDTKLKLGEASKMVNWKITRDGNLKRRPGTEFVAGLSPEYRLERSGDIAELQQVTDEDRFEVYQAASVTTVPGRVVLEGTGASMVGGVLMTSGATMRNGVLDFGDSDTANIVGGVLTVVNAASEISLAELREQLEALEPGSDLYLWHDELPYAINENSLYEVSGKQYLGGYLVKSVPARSAAVAGLWTGLVQGKETLLAACNGWLWSLYDEDSDRMIRRQLREVDTSGRVTFFPFGGNVYILDGDEYYVFNGEGVSVVTGYFPIVYKQVGPVVAGSDDSSSGEETGEYVNRLTPYRRVWLSPDGEGDTFPMPEKHIIWDSQCHVSYIGDTEPVPLEYGIDYTVDTDKGQITFTLTDEQDQPIHPAKSVNSYEVCYRAMSDADYASMRAQVTGNRFAELFSGPTDNMVYLYGDGTNRALYSGMDDDGMPRADYFPDQYEVHIGDANTPITAMIRHYGDLVCYKPDSTWAITQNAMELATGNDTVGVYCTPVNRDKGNVAPGQVRLVDNNPVTCSERELYHWVNSSYYTSTLSRDERQARRISDRIQSSIKEIDLTKCCMWDDNDGQEWYLSENKVTLVWNYVTDTWYRYEGIDAVCMCNFHGEVIYGTSDGLVARITYDAMGDMGYPIKAEWESGSIDFGAANMRKYSSSMWVGLKREEGTSVDVSLITDRKNTFKEKIVSSDKAKIEGQPFMVKVKLKAKKFVFYHLLFTVDDKQPAVTVTDVEFLVRQTGYAK